VADSIVVTSLQTGRTPIRTHEHWLRTLAESASRRFNVGADV